MNGESFGGLHALEHLPAETRLESAIRAFHVQIIPISEEEVLAGRRCVGTYTSYEVLRQPVEAGEWIQSDDLQAIGESAVGTTATVVDPAVCLTLQEYVDTRPIDPPAALELLAGIRDRSPQALRASIEIELQVLLLLVNGSASGDIVETDAQGNQVIVQAGSIPTQAAQIDASHTISNFVASECLTE